MKTNPSPVRMITMLGVAVSVLIRLKNVSEGPVERLPRESRSGIIGVYTSIVLMSKITLPEHILVCCFPALFSVFLILLGRLLSTTLCQRMSHLMISRKTSFRQLRKPCFAPQRFLFLVFLRPIECAASNDSAQLSRPSFSLSNILCH
jgi:hypothetical protein